MAQFGQLTILLTSVLTLVAGGVCFLGGQKEKWVQVGRRLMVAGAASGVLAMVVLVFLLVTHDYRVEYVRSYADKTMSDGFLITAMWGGQQGSLMFWAALQSIFGAAVAVWTTRNQKDLAPLGIGFMAVIALFFWMLVYTQSNPFKLSGEDPTSGIGLNPLLRNPYMVFHPPTLFLGFVGFSVPVAFALSALITGKLGDDWLHGIRPWILFAFGFLSIGNLLGMVWAYQELGWGGYWGWDPVENASLMPWITGTALVHSVMAEHRVKILRRWNVFLIALTYMLVIFGTFLTRSGVIQSVHAFSGATTGPYFLGALAAMGLGFGYLGILRYKALEPSKEIEIWSREWMFRLTNWLFLMATLFVWTATMWPLFMQIYKGEQVTVPPSFYNKWMVPVGLTIFAVLGICTVLPWKRFTWEKHGKPMAIPLAIGVATGIICAALGGVRPELGRVMAYAPSISVGMVAFVGSALLWGVRRSILAKNYTRLGGQTVHLAMVLMYVGFTGSGFIIERQGSMGPGEFMYLGDNKVTFLNIRGERDHTRESIYADLVLQDPSGDTKVVSPARYFYNSHPQQPTSEVAIETSITQDLFFILGETDFQRGRAVIKALVNPLVFWLWLGGLLLVVGTVVAIVKEGSMYALLKMEDETREKLTQPAIWTLVFLLAGIMGAVFFGFPALFIGLGAIVLVIVFALVGKAAVAALGK